MQRKNKQWFTLVELIIVITILAILATIAFVSFQGYSSEAKDSGKMSEVSEMVKKISIDEARVKDFSLSTYASGAATVSSIGTGGALNIVNLGMNSKNEYAYIYTASGTYVIAAKMNKATETGENAQSGVHELWTGQYYFIAWTQFIDDDFLNAASGSIKNYAK